MGSFAAYCGAFLTIKSSMGVGFSVGALLGAAVAFFIMSIVIKLAGHVRIKKIFPDIVTGSIIICIGITLIPVSIFMMKGNYLLALAAYNAGIGNVEEWINLGIIKPDGTDIENIPFKETNMYVRKILRDYEIYKKLY
jgi:xanthine/uracil permease